MTLTEAWHLPVVYRHWWIAEDQKDDAQVNKKKTHTDPFGREHEE